MTRPIYRYAQRFGSHLPRLVLRVDHIPFPGGLRPASISVLDGQIVVGTLALDDLERALREWRTEPCEASSSRGR